MIFDISMSLDGYITAAGRTPEEPMGRDGLRLVDWAIGDDERGRKLLDDAGLTSAASTSPPGSWTRSRSTLVPVLFGGGTPMFDDSVDGHVDLEPVEVIETPVAIHQRFRVVR